MNGRFIAFLIALLATARCQGALRISLPLRGLYHPGRYMPVAVWSDDEDARMQTLTLTADGAATTVVDCRLTQTPRIVPLLVMTSSLSHIAAVSSSGQRAEVSEALHPLELDQRLIACGAANAGLAGGIFPTDKIVAVQLDPRDAIADSAIAMQTLDAIVVDGSWPGGGWVEHLPTVLAGGTAVIVVTKARPDAVLPWDSIPGGWALSPTLAGPAGCDVGESAYLPTRAWHPDLTAAIRERVLLVGVLISLAAGACVLLPRKWALVLLVVFSASASACVLLWRQSNPVFFEISGSVFKQDGIWQQRDRWHYLVSPGANRVAVEAAGMTWPIFTDSSQMLRSHATLHLTDGQWTWELDAGGRAAFLTRAVTPARSPIPIINDSSSPLAVLARPIYSAVEEPQGVAPGSVGQWGGVFIRR